MSAPILGLGIIKGLAETARNFVGSYVKEDRLVTVQYPEERVPQPEAARKHANARLDALEQRGIGAVLAQIGFEAVRFRLRGAQHRDAPAIDRGRGG